MPKDKEIRVADLCINVDLVNGNGTGQIIVSGDGKLEYCDVDNLTIDETKQVAQIARDFINWKMNEPILRREKSSSTKIDDELNSLKERQNSALEWLKRKISTSNGGSTYRPTPTLEKIIRILEGTEEPTYPSK